mmetsp:Transcript_17478/g.43945  ORF Transcript_17478/g.43945 Transcript_17478/m.43945 type:complete len:149 (-) Transcript_17478:305-751(-)
MLTSLLASCVGQGLFAMRSFEKGEFISRYTGLLRSSEEFLASFKAGQTSGDYIFLLGGSRIYIDADDPTQSSVARYINHSVRKKNCVARDVCINYISFSGEPATLPLGVVYITATKQISKGEELFLDYGRTFWDSRAAGLRRLIIDYW